MATDDLRVIRDQIDHIDNQLLEMLTLRAELALLVLPVKKQQGQEVLDSGREQAVIHRLLSNNPGPLSQQAVRQIFNEIIYHCRQIQSSIVYGDKQGAEVQIAVQGDEGSFSQQAALAFCELKTLPAKKLHYAISSQSVVDLVLGGQCRYGILAINNAWGGLVHETIDALADAHYRIVDVFPIKIEQSLLAKPGVSLDQVTQVKSHAQALKQCRDYLKTHLPDTVCQEVADTAYATRQLAAGEYADDCAVIAHRSCADLYSLNVLKQGIEDLKENDTLFIVIAKHEVSP